MKFIEPAVLQDYVDKKWVSVQKHPTEDLYIYNYTQRCAFERMWDDVTMACRGLILNSEGEIIAKPFPKFFNLEEYIQMGSEVPPEDFEVYDKLDGSLGILYLLSDGTPCIATRGSFVSDQAIRGTKILQNKVLKRRKEGFIAFDTKNYTWLFEIIYPENRIVVDYGQTEDLFLLACIRIADGDETPISLIDMPFPKVNRFDGITDINTLKEMFRENSEGFVIRFPKTGLRLKVKYDEYVRLHRIVTGVNTKRIWEHLKNNESLNELLERVPDEFFKWVNETVLHLKNQFEIQENIAKEVYEKVVQLPSRKEQAIELMKPENREVSGIVFRMIDKKDYAEVIWKRIRPVAERPFKEDIDA